MYLRYYLDDKNQRVYTFAFYDPSGNPTISAHPGKFKPTMRIKFCSKSDEIILSPSL